MKITKENILFIVVSIFLMISGALNQIFSFVLGLVLTIAGIIFAYKNSKNS